MSLKLAGLSKASSSQLLAAAKCFTTSALQLSKEIPSISNIDPHHPEHFKAKQKAFRESLAAHKQMVDSQSSPPSAPGSSLSSAAASQVTVGESSNEKILGSFSPSNTGESATGSSAKSGEEGGSGRKPGALQSLIYGTEAGRQMDKELERSFSQMLARGKYVHSIVQHQVKPEKIDEYVELVGSWYPKVAQDPKNKVNLVGSWRTEVGDCDTFVHIWEYQRYHGYHDSLHTIWHHPEFAQFDQKLKTLITTKRVSLMQEFSFWPTTPPRRLGGIFELREYTLRPGELLTWETHWRKGLQARREVMEGVGAWFVQIGDLNTVYHLWQFPDLEQRREAREKSWSVEGWGDTVHKTVPLIQTMKSRIMVPMDWSPIG